jgi:phage shock protein C
LLSIRIFASFKNILLIRETPGKEEALTQDQRNWLQKFSKSEKDRWIGGVCGGLGEYTPVPSWVWRLLFVLLLICFGTGLAVYILLWIFVPRKTPGPNSSPEF